MGAFDEIASDESGSDASVSNASNDIPSTFNRCFLLEKNL